MRSQFDGRRAFALPASTPQYGPDKTVDVEHIDLLLTPDLPAQTLDGVATTTVRALDEPVESLSLDAVDFEVSSVRRDGKPLTFARRGSRLEIRFEPPIAPGESVSFAVAYRTVRPRHGLFFIEPTQHYPNLVAHAWTQSQDSNARFWFPCLDYPHEKQTTQQTIVVPKGQFALGNGALIGRRDDAATTTFVYRQDVPHSTYLVTMVVGPFVEREQRPAGAGATPVAYYVLPGREDEGERSFGKTPEMIEEFEKRIGTPYPYARYSQIAVSDFIFGGMENTSATTQTDRTLHDQTASLDFSSESLVSHELAHQWFGDLLTCRDWSHAWLNEGFATFFEFVWREKSLGYDEYLYDVFGAVARYLHEDADRYRRAIVCNRFVDPIELFDRHLYEKGGAVLHMLRGELGEARFWRSIRRYVERNARRNVETIDLIRAIEEATGRNLRGFFDRWIFGDGHPELAIKARWDDKRGALTVTIDQKQQCDVDSPPFSFDVEIGVTSDLPPAPPANFGSGPLPGEERVTVRVERAHETVTIPLKSAPKLVRFDPGAFVLGSVVDERGADFAAATLDADPDVVARIRAARALAKDGSKEARDAIGRAFGRDPFWGVLEEAAAALGATRAPWAKRILINALGHAHPKVRRGAAAALGNFRDPEAAAALVPVAEGDPSYFVRHAALHALGRTRDPRAFVVLVDAVAESSWNGIVPAGAARGLAELADARATDAVIGATALGRDESLRRIAVGALAQIGVLLESERTRVVAALDMLLDDPMFLVQLAAVAAVETLADARHLGSLERLAVQGFDGRVRRDASEAAVRIREARTAPGQLAGLRDDIETVREEQQKLREKLEAISRS
ncbi:MAG TPA: M1 family aminopeptidase [Candidatus Baltobacteraceae bacterium]